MKWLKLSAAASVLAVGIVLSAIPTADAGRPDGPTVSLGSVTGYRSAYFTMPFMEGSPAAVSVVGNGRSALDLFVYDADGNVTRGTGQGDQKSATVDVYRTGTFRVEVRNLGASMNTFRLFAN